jgi:hypothetical protein
MRDWEGPEPGQHLGDMCIAVSLAASKSRLAPQRYSYQILAEEKSTVNSTVRLMEFGITSDGENIGFRGDARLVGQ